MLFYFLIYINQNEENSFLEFIKKNHLDNYLTNQNQEKEKINKNYNIINESNKDNKEINDLKNDKFLNKIDNKEINDLKNENNLIINENNDLKNKNNQLLNEINDLKNENNQIKSENNDLKNKLLEKENDLIKIKIENEKLLNLVKMNNNKNTEEHTKKIYELYKKIEQLEKEKKELMPIIISFDQNMHAFICKKTDIFNQILNELFKKYPEYKENEYYYMVNGNKITSHKTIEENKINENDIILMYKIE